MIEATILMWIFWAAEWERVTFLVNTLPFCDSPVTPWEQLEAVTLL